MNGVWRVEKNLSVSRAIGDAGVCDLLHLPLCLPAVDDLFRVAIALRVDSVGVATSATLLLPRSTEIED
jgi:hypothetical protein